MTRFCLLSNHREGSSGQEQMLWLPQPMQLALQQLALQQLALQQLALQQLVTLLKLTNLQGNY
jgi:hypothetical protein